MLTVPDEVMWAVIIMGWLANAVAAAVLRRHVARPWSEVAGRGCAACGYPRTGLAPDARCPECGRAPGGGAPHAARPRWAGWAIGATASSLVMAAYGVILFFQVRPPELAGVAFFASFMFPAAALVCAHAVAPSGPTRGLSIGEAAAAAWFAGLGAVAASAAFVRVVDLSSDAQAGLALLGVSFPAAAGAGYGALIAALGALHTRTSRERETPKPAV